MTTIFITGSAGFIGYHLADLLLQQGHIVHGYDGISDYYDVRLKHARHARLREYPNFTATEALLENYSALEAALERAQPQIIVHLAAQAGVRYSIDNPRAYVDANLIGSFNIMEMARTYQVQHLLMASTSSIYGANTAMPYKETDKADTQMSFYAATKKANEAMAHSYAHIHGIPITMFRFFTVYGPWGRPDMAVWLFTEAIEQGKEIKVFNNGQLWRDFTYIDDIVTGVIATADKPPVDKSVPFEIFNIGNHQPVLLETFITTLEKVLGKTANKIYLPMQAGDVLTTYADTEKLQQAVGFSPNTSLEEGLIQFVDWYRSYPQAI